MRCILVLCALVLVLFALQGSFGRKSKSVKHYKEEDITDIVTSEGNEGWLQKVLKMAKAKHQKKPSAPKKGKSWDQSHDNDSPPEDVISRLDSSLNQIESDNTEQNKRWISRAKNGLIDLKNKWDVTPPARRGAIAGALNTAAGKLEKFANAGKDPVGAIRGAIEIVASFANLAGPTGQIVSVVLNFISGILSLFGKGPSPKPIGEVVREEIEQWYSRDLSNKAEGAIDLFRKSKAFLNGVSKSGDRLSDAEATSLSTNVPVYSGVEFMGTLASEIRNIIRNNKLDEVKKCLNYIELYARMAVLKDVILQQMAALIPDSQPNIREGIYEFERSIQTSVKELLKFLYESEIGNNIIPYFDPDKYEITDAYMSEILQVDNYDRSMAGYYFINVFRTNNILGRLGYREYLPLVNEEFRGLTILSNDATEFNFYWKLVPHGKNLFSIVNKYQCPENDLCDALLTWRNSMFDQMATIEHDHPALWEITKKPNGGQFRIRCKLGCNSKPPHEMCDAQLSYKFFPYFPFYHTIPQNSKLDWAIITKEDGKAWGLRKLHRKTHGKSGRPV